MRIHPLAAERKKRLSRRRIKFHVSAGFFALLILGAVYILRETALFTIRSVEVIGLERLQADRLLEAMRSSTSARGIGKFLGPDNYLSWPREIVPPTPLIAEMMLAKDLFSKQIIVTARERNRYGVWCVSLAARDAPREAAGEDEAREAPAPPDKRCYWFDDKGIVFEDALVSRGQLVFRVSEASGKPLEPRDAVLPEQQFANLKSILEYLRRAAFSFADVSIDRVLEEMRVVAAEGATLIFSLRFDQQTNLSALSELLKTMPLGNIDYIDLTVPGKLYLKKRLH